MSDIDRLPYEQAFSCIRADFLEMPCLRRTAAQVAMLCVVERAICETVPRDLLRAGILRSAERQDILRLDSGRRLTPSQIERPESPSMTCLAQQRPLARFPERCVWTNR